LRPGADAFRMPFGPALSVVGLATAVALMTSLRPREVALMLVPAMAAAVNWMWARRVHLVT
jgi:hypothetical protein